MHYNFCCWLVLVLCELFIQTTSIICQLVIDFCIWDIWIFLCFPGSFQPIIYYANMNCIPDLLLYCSYWCIAILSSPWSDLGSGNADVSVIFFVMTISYVFGGAVLCALNRYSMLVLCLYHSYLMQRSAVNRAPLITEKFSCWFALTH